MNQLSDEFLNKYIDNELSSVELEQVEKFLSENPGALRKLKAHKVVDQNLSEMNFEKAPGYLSAKIMNTIAGASLVKNQKPYFLYSIFGIFGTIICSIIGYIIYNMPSNADNIGTGHSIMNDFHSFISNAFSPFGFLAESNNVIIIGFSLTFILVVGFFMMLNFQRHALTKLNNLGH